MSERIVNSENGSETGTVLSDIDVDDTKFDSTDELEMNENFCFSGIIYSLPRRKLSSCRIE